MERRTFLLGGLGVAVVAGLGVLGAGPAAEAQIASLVRRRLGFLKLDEAGLKQFSKDQVSALLAKRPTWNRWKYHFLVLFTKSFTQYGTSNDTRTRLQRTADSFATTYLLSSDFFVNGADESRTIEYTGLYDPLRPCSSPFARPPLDRPAAS